MKIKIKNELFIIILFKVSKLKNIRRVEFMKQLYSRLSI